MEVTAIKTMVASLVAEMQLQRVSSSTATTGPSKKRRREVEESDDSGDEGSDDVQMAPSPKQMRYQNATRTD